MSETGKIVTTGNMEKFKDLLAQEYIKELSVSGKTITYTKGHGTTGTITTQDTNTTYTAGPGLSLSSTKFSNSAPVYFIKGTQTASTNAWTGALPTGVTAYADGLTINYYLPYAGTSSAATLNLGSLGAKNVYRGDSNGTITTHFPAGSVIQLVYIASLNSNAGGWKATAYYDSTYSAMSASEATTGTATSSRVITAKVLNDKINEVVSANAYSLPAATSSTLGGVKVGSNITNSSGTISLTKENVTAALGYTPPTTDTNTDTKVTNTLATTTKAYVTGTTSSSTNTGTQVFDTGVYLSTTAGELVATKFTGALNGNANTATSATKATQDSAGQQINSTYIKGLSVSGKTVTYTKGDGTTGTITTQDTDTHYTTGLKVGASSSATANAAASNGAVYLNVLDNTTVRDSHLIKGSGATTVTSDANGVITISSTDNNTNTVNTAGATNTSSKIFLVGATSQAASPQTYTHDTAYVGTDGCLYSNNTKVSVEGHTHSYATPANTIKSLSASGTTITYTKGDGTTGTITTQDTNTDTKVTNTLATTTKAYLTGTTSSSTNTGTQVFDTGVYLSTTAGELVATKFTGALNGNAATATKATQDGSGNVITSTYAPKYEYSTTDLEAGTSSLTTGKLYIVYE